MRMCEREMGGERIQMVEARSQLGITRTGRGERTQMSKSSSQQGNE